MAPGDVLGPEAIFVPAFNDIPVSFTRTALMLSAGVPYRVTVSGTLQFNPNPDYFACGAPSPTPLPTLVPNPVGPAGLDNFPGKYAVVVGRGTATDAPSSALNLQPRSGSAGSVTGFVDGPGVLWVARPSVLGNACGNPTSPHNPGWTVSGSQEIQAEELEPPSITVDKARVKVGDTVRAELVIPSWVSSYFVLTGWVWVPAPGASGTARFIEGCSRTSTFCRAEVGDSGHFEVRDIGVNGVMFLTARSETIAVGVLGLRVTLTLDREVVRPTIPPFGFPSCKTAYANVPGDHALVTVHGDYDDGSPAVGASVELEAVFVERSGGHDHPNENRLNFGVFGADEHGAGGTRIGRVFGVLDANGEYKTRYGDLLVGGEERLRVTVRDGPQQQQAEKTLTVDVGGLQSLGGAEDWVLIGTEGYPGTNHLSNHWGDPASLSLTERLARAMRQVANRGPHADENLVLQLNDFSIENGGLFDIFANYAPDHQGHRHGVDADIDDVYSTSGGSRVHAGTPIPYNTLRRMVHGLRKGAPDPLDEGDHFHVRWQPCP